MISNVISKRCDRGYSLVELLVTAALGGILLIGVFTFLGRSTQKAAAYLETSEMDERRNLFGDLIRLDLDRAGSNLLYSPIVSGGLVAGLFLASNDYDSSPGTLSKTGSDGWGAAADLTSTIVSGEGYIEYTPPQTGCLVSLFSRHDKSSRLIFIDKADAPGVANIFIQEDGGKTVATPPRHHAGDLYRIAIEPDVARGRVINYYRSRNGIRTLLYTSTAPMLLYPVGASASLLEKGSSITGIQFFASVMSDANVAGAQMPPLPFDAWTGSRLTDALTVVRGTPIASKRACIILSGDRKVDPLFLQAGFSGSDATLMVNMPSRGKLVGGEILLLVDRSPGARASALYQIQNATPNASGYVLSVSRVTRENPAWQRLYSDETDFVHLFPSGSMAVKLSPPVTYGLTLGNRVVRSEGYTAKGTFLGADQREATATALLGATDFNLSDTSDTVTGARSYMISLTLHTEGYETGAATQTYTYKATPRALNGTPDWTKLLPQN